ncbi:KpsF/GutQ family sugar-phosphate isomerase [Candidatus Aerophobetes bacterium]|uniref:KpsF/GutQ family sugar-phosphate isomerase n=1 Tax=Aerophobetes bacterium TaxID=2030807 RepID=A0A2A4YDE0_UNCAE|nr:MAG: KpsF/GutQ family sugar-phosphate isomerase [Candidatus Aerophobetes bacterium]
MLKQLLETQKQYLDYFFDSIDLNIAEKILETLVNCKGSIFFTGVGKSGIIAEKLAMTMISVGTKAFYLPPTNALHGDIGILSEEDVFVFLSKSGETKELLSLLPFVKQRKVKVISWVSRSSSSLAKRSDCSITLPLARELCPFDLAPTTSAVIQLIFGDVLAVALMKRKSFSLQDYAKNHPAGSIGSRITQTVDDIMVSGKDLPVCCTGDKLKDVLVELTNKRCGCLLVVDKTKKLCGIFTDGDLRRALQENPNSILDEEMQSLMTKNFLSVVKQKLVHEAAEVMQRDSSKWVMMLPVVEENKLVGLVRMHDIINFNL